MLHTMRRLAKQQDLKATIAHLDEIRTHLFRSPSLRIIVTCEEAMVEPLERLLSKLIEALPADGPGEEQGNATRPSPTETAPEARIVPVPVAFNVRFFKTVRFTHPDSPALLVLSNYLRDTFLHRELREKGGAYGAGTVFTLSNTASSLFTARSPHRPKSHIASDFLREGNHGSLPSVAPAVMAPNLSGARQPTVYP